jgi:hypothetical protein
MPLNNTNLKFNNQTSFVPSNYIEKMTTYEHLATAEKELRSALATVVDTASPTLLTRLIHLLDSINDIKRGFVSNDIVSGGTSATDATKTDVSNFTVTTSDTSDTIDYGYGAAGPVDYPTSFGQDVITFS